jgi:hypothetical protein
VILRRMRIDDLYAGGCVSGSAVRPAVGFAPTR